MSKYSVVYIFTKRTNLKDFFDTDKVLGRCNSQLQVDAMRRHYEHERDVQLICMFRREKTTKGTKIFCKIKCPINPLPVRGEFEVPDTGAITMFLEANGWNIKQKLYTSMFE